MSPKGHNHQHNQGPEIEIDLSKVEARVDRVKFQGLDRTKDDVVQHLARGLMERTGTFEEIVLRATMLRNHLLSMNGSFKDATITIDASKDSPNGYDVTIRVVESSFITGQVNTSVESTSLSSYPSLQSEIRLPNIVGRGESIAFQYTKSKSESLSGFSFTASKPWIFRVPGIIDACSPNMDPLTLFRMFPMASVSVHKGSTEFPLSGLSQREQGLSFDLMSFPSNSLTSRIRLEGNYKNMSSCMSEVSDNPLHIQHNSGDYSKVSLKHIIEFDNRNFDSKSFFPSNGIKTSLSQELAGFVGNQSFIKHEAAFEGNLRIPKTRILLQACLRSGILFDREGLAATRSGRFPALSERFFVGGPLTMRGFGHFGIGPRTPEIVQGNAEKSPTFVLGSDVFWTGGLHAYLPLPFVSSPKAPSGSLPSFIHKCLRLHAFANAGIASDMIESVKKSNPSRYSKNEMVKAIIREVQNDIRISVGVGLAAQLGQYIRLEVNYAKPLRFNKSDLLDPGFQFGFGIHFN